LQPKPDKYIFGLSGGEWKMKKQPSKSPGTSVPTVEVHELTDADQAMVGFLEEHFPELDPEHFLRWSRSTLKAQWEAQRRIFN
jgi:hypothetical protein